MKRSRPRVERKYSKEIMRGCWPDPKPCIRRGRYNWLQIRIDPLTYRALQKVIGAARYSCMLNIEEAIYTAVRGMVGKTEKYGLTLDTLVRAVAYQRDISFATALYGGDNKEAEATTLLLSAAYYAAHGAKAADLVEFADEKVIALLKAVLPHRDLDKEIAEVRAHQAAWEEQELKSLEAEAPTEEVTGPSPDRDLSPDDIPF
jgi:hypothetical protein